LPDILKNIRKCETDIKYVFEKAESEIFHRTKFLNKMLMMTKTPVVINYDIDILLEPYVYKKCTDKILNGIDLIYPYFWGDSQRRVFYNGRNKLKIFLDLTKLIPEEYDICRSEYGHCQFFNRNSYINGGMENENFISYAPEDQERGYRFKTLGYKVEWSNDHVYHMEHTRGNNSSSNNIMMDHNNRLFEYIKSLDKNNLYKYYKEINYSRNE
jgi:hypothetical protein